MNNLLPYKEYETIYLVGGGGGIYIGRTYGYIMNYLLVP